MSISRSPRRSDRSVWHTLHTDRNFHQYKLHIVHSLIDRDEEVRLRLCRHFQGTLADSPDLPTYAALHDAVNRQNSRYRSAADPHQLHQRLVYDPEVTVWSRGVTGPYVFEDEDGRAITATPQRYTQIINEFLAPNLPPNQTCCFNKMVLRPTRQ